MNVIDARTLFLDHCTHNGLEHYGERAAVAAITVERERYEELRTHVAHLLYAIDRGYFTDDYLANSAFVQPLREYVK